MFDQYFQRVEAILQEVQRTQGEKIRLASRKMAETIVRHDNLFAFGSGHAGLLAQELLYRTGGLAVINIIYAPGLTLDVRPITLTSKAERLKDYGRMLADASGIGKGDLLLIHSVSGRNTVPVDVALRAKELEAYVVCLTNLKYSQSVPSRHPSGKRLFEVSDLVLDNCGDVGDAAMQIPGMRQKVAATSTAVGAVILNSMVAETAAILAAQGIVPPVFCSANMEGGDEVNQEVLDTYRSNIRYM